VKRVHLGAGWFLVTILTPTPVVAQDLLLAAFGAAGYAEREHGMRHNLALAYASMGLYSRARRMALAVLEAEATSQNLFSRALTTGVMPLIESAAPKR